jgi:two-component system sensor histidine kinase KdpD
MEWSRRLGVRGLSPIAAALTGAAGVGLATLSALLLRHSMGQAGQALLLVVPVTATAVLGGRLPGLLTATVATAAFTLLLPPVGELRLRFAEDAVALGVFSVVAVVISNLVGHRIEALEWIERQRAALLRSVSHDLRTPLAAIRVAISELGDEELHDEATRQRLLTLVGDEAERLDRLVGNLLSLARIEGGGLQPRRQAVDLGELVDDCLTRLGHALASTAVVVHNDGDLPMVMADHTLLGQVVTNLVENAVRHSPPGESVEIELHHVARCVELSVSDHGPGVSEDDAATIFEPFRSGALAGSSGVGLAICKAVVEAHDGTIVVRGLPQHGAVFTVTLPDRRY